MTIRKTKKELRKKGFYIKDWKFKKTPHGIIARIPPPKLIEME